MPVIFSWLNCQFHPSLRDYQGQNPEKAGIIVITLNSICPQQKAKDSCSLSQSLNRDYLAGDSANQETYIW